MPKPYHSNLKQKGRTRSATGSNISFGHFHRMAPFSKTRGANGRFNLKGKGEY